MTTPPSGRLFIEGYPDQLSVSAGDEIGFHISTNAQKYSIEIARVGAERQVVWTRDDVSGVEYEIPDNASSHGCGWPLTVAVPVPEEWKSGYYSVMLRASRGGQTTEGEMFFVVRAMHPGREARILLQLTTNTSNAYNTFGGSNLYRGPEGPARRVSFDRPYTGFPSSEGIFLFPMAGEFQDVLEAGTVTASLQEEFHRKAVEYRVPGPYIHASPIALSERGTITTDREGEQWRIEDLSGNGPPEYKIRKEADGLNVHEATTAWENEWRRWEQPFVAWAERQGYRIEYAVSSDLEFHPEILPHYRLILSVGHDEYWSSPMRDHLEEFIAAGGNVAFFSGNAVWWQVRSEDNGRALVCWKEAYKQDPVYESGDHKLLSTMWCHGLIGRPENQLTGVSFAYGGYYNFFDQFLDSPGAYTVHRPEHWILEGTGLTGGDLLGQQDRIVGYECDGCDFELRDGLPVPTHRDGTPEGFEILATAPAGLTTQDDSLGLVSGALYGEGSGKQHPQPGATVLGTYTRAGTVVTTGCTQWAYGLRGRDKTVERITRNILDRLSV